MSGELNISGGGQVNAEEKPSGNYFGKREEEAVSQYIHSENPAERQKIFNEILKPAFTKMIESLIRRYGLFVLDESFEDTFNDTLSNLMMKIDKFDASKGFKAYSYCGTVCKNYLIRKRKESQKNDSLNVSFNPSYGNGVADGDESEEALEEKNRFNRNLIDKMRDAIQRSVDNREWQNLTEPEYRVGVALLQLLSDWRDVFGNFERDYSKKYSKMNVLYYLKENTMLPMDDVRDAMKRYKLLYMIVKGDYLHDIY